MMAAGLGPRTGDVGVNDKRLNKAKDLAVTAGAVVTVLAGFLAAVNYLLDSKLAPVHAELTSIRADLHAMNERHERRLVRLENLHLTPAGTDAVSKD